MNLTNNLTTSTLDTYDCTVQYEQQQRLFEDEPEAEEPHSPPFIGSRLSLSDGSCPSLLNSPRSPPQKIPNPFGEDGQNPLKTGTLQELLAILNVVLETMRNTDEKYDSVCVAFKQALVDRGIPWDDSIPKEDRRVVWSGMISDSTGRENTFKCYARFWKEHFLEGSL